MPPVPRMIHKSVLTRIVENVKTGLCKRAPHAVLLSQHTVVRLLLQLELTTVRRAERQFRSEMFSKKLHGIALITAHLQSHPDEMNVIRHENISRTMQALASGGMQKQFAELQMEGVVHQPLARRSSVMVQWTTANPR